MKKFMHGLVFVACFAFSLSDVRAMTIPEENVLTGEERIYQDHLNNLFYPSVVRCKDMCRGLVSISKLPENRQICVVAAYMSKSLESSDIKTVMLRCGLKKEVLEAALKLSRNEELMLEMRDLYLDEMLTKELPYK